MPQLPNNGQVESPCLNPTLFLSSQRVLLRDLQDGNLYNSTTYRFTSLKSLIHIQVAVTLDSTFFLKMASNHEEPLTQEELLNGRPNSRVFTLDANDSRNPAKRKLQFFSVYSPIRVGGALPVTLHDGIWHQLTKEFRLANAAPGIHDYDKQSITSKEKEKSLPDTEDDIDESLQKAIDESIRASPIVPNAVLPSQYGLILDAPTMSTTIAPTEMVAFTATTSTKEEWIAKVLG